MSGRWRFRFRLLFEWRTLNKYYLWWVIVFYFAKSNKIMQGAYEYLHSLLATVAWNISWLAHATTVWHIQHGALMLSQEFQFACWSSRADPLRLGEVKSCRISLSKLSLAATVAWNISWSTYAMTTWHMGRLCTKLIPVRMLIVSCRSSPARLASGKNL
jgi:peptidoglycan/LPS O-acetylase OafA/YrhL